MILENDYLFEKQLKAAYAKYGDYKEAVLCSTLTQPNEITNSAARKIMYDLHNGHHVPLLEPQIPHLGTGHENQLAHESSSFQKTNKNLWVVDVIHKYDNHPKLEYDIIVTDDSNNLDVISVSKCRTTSETYGFVWNNDYLNTLKEGDCIPAGTVLRTSSSFDEFGNYMAGRNANVIYASPEDTDQDSIIVNDEFASKMGTYSFHTLWIRINENDIPINLYGDKTEYKIIPDIGEEIKDGILCAIRRESHEDFLFTQSRDNLVKIMMPDEVKTLHGTVMSIEVFNNKRPNSRNVSEDGSLYSIYEKQLEKYDVEHKDYCQRFVNSMSLYDKNKDYHLSPSLSEINYKCKRVLNGDQYIYDKIYSNLLIKVIVLAVNPLHEGDKISNRYGGKGVISKILPKNMMPRIHGTDIVADVVWDQFTCVNRLNLAQLSETSINNISRALLCYLDEKVLHLDEYLENIIEYMSLLSPNLAEFYKEKLELMTDEEVIELVSTLINEEGSIYLSLEPISEVVDYDKVVKIHKIFSKLGDRIKPQYFDVALENSDGTYRYVKSYKPSIISSQYILRLKQCAEEKHSVTSMSNVNIKGENTKDKSHKNYSSPYSSTPIRCGSMETNLINHIRSVSTKIDYFFTMSTSPTGRKRMGEALTGDPYNVNIKVDIDDKSRSAEYIHTLLKAIGLRIHFSKRRKLRSSPFKMIPFRTLTEDEVKIKVKKYKEHGKVKQPYNPFKVLTEDEVKAKID